MLVAFCCRITANHPHVLGIFSPPVTMFSTGTKRFATFPGGFYYPRIRFGDYSSLSVTIFSTGIERRGTLLRQDKTGEMRNQFFFPGKKLGIPFYSLEISPL